MQDHGGKIMYGTIAIHNSDIESMEKHEICKETIINFATTLPLYACTLIAVFNEFIEASLKANHINAASIKMAGNLLEKSVDFITASINALKILKFLSRNKQMTSDEFVDAANVILRTFNKTCE